MKEERSIRQLTDAAFFVLNPNRRFRVRKTIKEDLNPGFVPDDFDLTIVEKTEAGKPVLHVYNMNGNVYDTDEDAQLFLQHVKNSRWKPVKHEREPFDDEGALTDEKVDAAERNVLMQLIDFPQLVNHLPSTGFNVTDKPFRVDERNLAFNLLLCGERLWHYQNVPHNIGSEFQKSARIMIAACAAESVECPQPKPGDLDYDFPF